MHQSLWPKARARLCLFWLASSLGGLSCCPLCINVGVVSDTSSLFTYTMLNGSIVFWQHWRSLDVRVICSFLTTLVQSHKCSHCTCTLSALFCRNDGAVKGSCLYVHVICSFFSQPWCCETNAMYLHAISSQRWCCQINQSVYVHVICSKLVLSDKPVCVCALYLLQVGAVR